jgi:hypothetical protein
MSWTHATQDARGLEKCLDRELEAHKVGINIWESFWSNEIPPRRSRLEHEMGDVLITLREGGDPGLSELLAPVYKRQCAASR